MDLLRRHYRDERELRRLREHFASEYGYTTATGIPHPDAFATWLGIDFAPGLDKTADVKLNSFEEIAFARSSYETSLWRVHTRSTRSFTSITVPSATRTNPGASTRRSIGTIRIPDRGRGFTKRTSFRAQSEYRFAVSTLGDPVESKRYIAVSPELRAPVSAL